MRSIAIRRECFDVLGEFGDGFAAILLKQRENLAVDGIEFDLHVSANLGLPTG